MAHYNSITDLSQQTQHLDALPDVEASSRQLKQAYQALQARKPFKRCSSYASFSSAANQERKGHERLHHRVLDGQQALQHACRVANE